MKRLLTVFLVLMSSACAKAASEVVDGVTWYYETHELFLGGNYAEVVAGAVKYAGDLTIPSSLGGNPVTQIGASAFHDCSELQSVIIPSSVTYIGWGAFSECRKLEVVKIPSSVTSIASSAFEGCVGIKSATIPACVYWMSVTFPDSFATISEVVILDGVTTIRQYAFSNCQGLKSVTIPEGVTSIEEDAFYNCHTLTSLRIPSSVTSIGKSAFSECSGLASVTLPLGVKNISQFTFSGCAGLKSVTIPPSVTRIEMDAFQGCGGLTEVRISDVSAWCGIEFECWMQGSEDAWTWMCANPLVYAHKLFVGENEVVDLQIPDGVTFISEAAFCGSDIKTVTIPPRVKRIGKHAFAACSELTAVAIPASVVSIEDDVFSGCKLLESVTIPKGVQTIGDNAFSGCGRIASVLIPSSVTSVASSAFRYCDSLKHIEVEAGNPSYKVVNNCLVTVDDTTLAAVPFGCNEVAIPEGITEIPECMFDDDWKLQSVTIPSGVTTVGRYAFSLCSGLKHVTIPKSVTDIGEGAFCGCAGLESVTISEGVKSIGASAFSGCKLLMSVQIPKSVTSIGSSAFSECYKLTSAAIPWGVASIEDYTFANCWALESVSIPSSVTSIGAWAFWLCDDLTSVTIPASVKSIGSSAFYNCFSLEVIHVGKGGDIGAVKQMLHESGLNVNRVTFDYVDDPDRVDCKVVFNAQGGTAAWTEATVPKDKTIGEIPAVTRDGYELLGWFTAAVGGTQVTAATVVTADVTYYAQWRKVTILPVGGDPAIVCEIAAEYRTKADVGVIPVEVVNVGEAVKIAVKGLPSGVKFTAKDVVDRKTKDVTVPVNSIYGAPTKSGVYAATVTVTPTDRKSKMEKLMKTLTFVVRNAGEHVVRVDCDAAQGSVKGMGVYAPGKKVTLKATAAKGWVFAGWYDGNALVSPLASYALTMPEKDVNLTARFISDAEDKAAIRLAVDGTALSGGSGQETASPLSVEVRVGMYVEWPVAASALSATTVKVSGLPSGLKFTAKDVKATNTSAAVPANTIYGTPKTASKVDKNGKVTPSKVKIVVTTAGKSKQEYILNVTVLGIPAEGTFNGGGENGLVTLTVAKTGKISGKYLADGKTWTLSAAGFDTWDDNDRLTATLTAKCGKEVQTLALVYADGRVCASLTSGGDAASPLFEAWRNEWKTGPQKSLATKLKGQNVMVGENGNIVLTVGANGAVTAKGAFVTGFDEKKQKDVAYSASCSTVLIPTEFEGRYVVYLYFPPKAGKFEGFSGMVEIGLGDD